MFKAPHKVRYAVQHAGGSGFAFALLNRLNLQSSIFRDVKVNGNDYYVQVDLVTLVDFAQASDVYSIISSNIQAAGYRITSISHASAQATQIINAGGSILTTGNTVSSGVSVLNSQPAASPAQSWNNAGDSGAWLATSQAPQGAGMSTGTVLLIGLGAIVVVALMASK